LSQGCLDLLVTGVKGGRGIILCNFGVYFSLVTQEIKQSVVKGEGKIYNLIFREGKKGKNNP
jgi:hypothetical protein